MVAKTVYLFIGQDSLSKEVKLKKLRQDSFAKELEQFNLDILYARELNLKTLQEKLLCLPFKAKRRMLLIKEAQALKEDIKRFILEYVKKPQPTIFLILDIDRYNPKDEFIKCLAKYSELIHFKEPARLDTFTLGRAIELKSTDYSLRVLNHLLRGGEKPERILGGLRYVWEKNITNPLQIRKRLKLLLDCDIDIKTGRLKPDFALEKFVVSLCCFDKPLA